MGNLYFIIKSSILTFLIVCLLQIQFRDRTLEDRLMTLIRTTLAPKVLGKDSRQIDHNKYKLSPDEISKIKRKVFESEALKDIKESTKDIIFKEMKDVMKNSQEKDENQ